MFELLKVEFVKFRTWSAWLSLAMLLTFSYLSSERSILNARFANQLVLGAAIAGSVAFGFLQMLLHRRSNHWTYLVHRPLATPRIYGALMGAGVVSIFLVVSLPMFVVTASRDWFTDQVIDARHYANIWSVLWMSYVVYFLSTLVVLNASRGTVLLYLTFGIVLTTIPSSSLGRFVPLVISVGVLLYLNLSSFKPDLTTHVQRPLAIMLLCIPMSLAILIVCTASVLIGYSVLSQFVNGGGGHNDASDTVEHLQSLADPAERLAHALKGSTHPRAEYYVQQAALAECDSGQLSERTFPYRGQFVDQSRYWQYDHERSNSRWQFSHDSMLLEGRRRKTGGIVGAFGKRGFMSDPDQATDEDRFEEVPLLVGDRLLTTTTQIFLVDYETRFLELKHELDDGEAYIDIPQRSGEYMLVPTTEQILLFDAENFLREGGVAAAEYSVPYPVHFGDIDGWWSYRLVDGFALLFYGEDFYGDDRPGAAVVHARLSSGIEQIGLRHFVDHARPFWVRKLDGLISPVLIIGVAGVSEVIQGDGSRFRRRLESFNYPVGARWLMGFLLIASGVCGAILCRLHGLGRSQTMMWCALTGIIGLPALAAFFLMNPWRTEGARGHSEENRVQRKFRKPLVVPESV